MDKIVAIKKWMKRFFIALTVNMFMLFPAWSLEQVTLQLKWQHQFQFAGYYAALEKGYYDEVGLDVQIKERDISKDAKNERGKHL